MISKDTWENISDAMDRERAEDLGLLLEAFRLQKKGARYLAPFWGE